MFKKIFLGTVILKLKISTIFHHNLRNIPKYAKWVKYSLTHEIFSNMQKKLFSMHSELNESSTFFTLIRLHRPSNDM